MLNLGFGMQYKHKTGLFWLWAVLPALAGIGCGDEDTSTEPVDESDPTVLADTYALTSDNRLVYFERASGNIRSSAEISGLATGEAMVGLDFRPAGGELFALGTTGGLYTIDTATGVATLKTTLVADTADATNPYSALEGDVFGVNFNPVADRLRVVSNSGQNLRINVDTGATTTDADLNPGAPSITTAAYSNSFSATCRTRLYVIDTSTNTLFLQDPPNAGTLTELGPLSMTSAPGAVLEVITLSGSNRELSNLALVLLPAPNGAMVYDLDLNNGDLFGGRALRLRDGESLLGVSAAPPSEAPVQGKGELVGVTFENQVVSFNRGAPGKLCTSAAIAGLGAGEDVLGIDSRPADGALYALSSAGKLYTVVVESGVGDAEIDPGGRRHGHDGAVHDPAGDRLWDRLQPGPRSPARGQPNRAKPAHQRRHRRHHDGRGAVAGIHDRAGGGVHQRLCRRDQHGALRGGRRERSADPDRRQSRHGRRLP